MGRNLAALWPSAGGTTESTYQAERRASRKRAALLGRLSGCRAYRRGYCKPAEKAKKTRFAPDLFGLEPRGETLPTGSGALPSVNSGFAGSRLIRDSFPVQCRSRNR
jgi:hypothetical protein